jgi:DNA-binding transcriptional ArsR family regulator
MTAAEVAARLRTLTQRELAKVERYERRGQSRQTILSRVASLREKEPWRGYDEATVKEIREKLGNAKADRLTAVRDYERRHRDRSGVMDAVRRKIGPTTVNALVNVQGALAPDPPGHRRAPRGRPATVGEASGGFGVSKPAITKHLRVLEDRRRDARGRRPHSPAVARAPRARRGRRLDGSPARPLGAPVRRRRRVPEGGGSR